MDNDLYNTFVKSDSDNDSVIIVDPGTSGTDQTNITPYKYNCPMSPEEPEFFAQVIQRVRLSY